MRALLAVVIHILRTVHTFAKLGQGFALPDIKYWCLQEITDRLIGYRTRKDVAIRLQGKAMPWHVAIPMAKITSLSLVALHISALKIAFHANFIGIGISGTTKFPILFDIC